MNSDQTGWKVIDAVRMLVLNEEQDWNYRPHKPSGIFNDHGRERIISELS
jgi:hypothetical protein